MSYDPHLVVGVLGGASGTTRDAFQLLADVQKHGGKVALFGRKINASENQLAFVQFLHLIVDGAIGPIDAVKAYHAVLEKLGVRPQRPLEDDLKLQSLAMSYGGSTSTSIVVPSTKPATIEAHACRCHEHESNGAAILNGAATPKKESFPTRAGGLPDFAKMNVSQRLAYHRDRLGLGR